MFRNKDKSLTILPGKHVDTGMGMERITSILQGKMSNYDTDLFTPIFDAIHNKTGVRPYTGKVGAEDVDGIDMAYRVVADHIRTLTIAITDGAQPGSEGRSYVIRYGARSQKRDAQREVHRSRNVLLLSRSARSCAGRGGSDAAARRRRVMRRGVRYARQYLFPEGAKYEAGFFAGLSSLVIDLLGDTFPELRGNPGTGMTPEKVSQIILEEEVSFLKTLDRGIAMFEKFAALDQASGKISGPHAFMLYDTFGFPIDLTLLMAEEKGMVVDQDGYDAAMAEQKAKSRGEAKEGAIVLTLEAEQTDKVANELKVAPTVDLKKYEWTSAGHGPSPSATVRAIWTGKEFVQEAAEGAFVGFILDETNFYAEAGGQLYDTGRIASADATCSVENVQKFGGFILHSASVTSGALKVGDAVELAVDYERRSALAANHTTTHLLNWALRKVLEGHQIDQRGSIVGPDKLRFDFSYGKPMTAGEIDKVQTLVREIIKGGFDSNRKEVPLAAAKQIKALRAVFGEVYPDPVRVVSVGPVPHTIETLLAQPDNDEWHKLSVEFCGGTHMDNTREAADFAVIGEEGTAKGVRRLICVTKDAAREARAAADEFDARVQKAGAIADMAELDGEIAALRTDVETVTMDYARKDQIKGAIDALKNKVLAAEKEALKAKLAAAEAWATELSVAGRAAVVEVVDVDGDVKALDNAMKVVVGKAPETPVCFLSRNARGDKVACLAVVPKACAGKLDAKDWINAALEKCGGKGGGKPDRAQGAAKDAANFDAAVKAAQDYPAGKV